MAESGAYRHQSRAGLRSEILFPNRNDRDFRKPMFFCARSNTGCRWSTDCKRTRCHKLKLNEPLVAGDGFPRISSR